VTGSLMLATVAAEFASARLMRRYGYRTVFAAGALLLGGPALALMGPHSVVMIVAVSIARGLGFGLNTVVIGALVATRLPPERRGEGIGLGRGRGLRAGDRGPAVRGLAGENTGYALVIAITAVSALAPLAAGPLAGRAGRPPGSGPGRGAAGRAAGQPAVRRPAAALAGLRGDDRIGRGARRVPCRSRPGCPAEPPRSGCSCRPWPPPRAGGGPGDTATVTATRPAGSRAADGRRRDERPDLGGGPGSTDHRHVPVRDRLRDQPERHVRADDRPGAGLRLRHRQRAVEPGLRRRLWRRSRRVRRVRGLQPATRRPSPSPGR